MRYRGHPGVTKMRCMWCRAGARGKEGRSVRDWWSCSYCLEPDIRVISYRGYQGTVVRRGGSPALVDSGFDVWHSLCTMTRIYHIYGGDINPNTFALSFPAVLRFFHTCNTAAGARIQETCLWIKWGCDCEKAQKREIGRKRATWNRATKNETAFAYVYYIDAFRSANDIQHWFQVFRPQNRGTVS